PFARLVFRGIIRRRRPPRPLQPMPRRGKLLLIRELTVSFGRIAYIGTQGWRRLPVRPGRAGRSQRTRAMDSTATVRDKDRRDGATSLGGAPVPHRDDAEPRNLGRYRVLRTLGDGGMSTV